MKLVYLQLFKMGRYVVVLVSDRVRNRDGEKNKIFGSKSTINHKGVYPETQQKQTVHGKTERPMVSWAGSK